MKDSEDIFGKYNDRCKTIFICQVSAKTPDTPVSQLVPFTRFDKLSDIEGDQGKGDSGSNERRIGTTPGGAFQLPSLLEFTEAVVFDTPPSAPALVA